MSIIFDIDVTKAMSVTGHRPDKLGGYNYFNPIMQNILYKMSHIVEEKISDGYEYFISGMALGVDTLFAHCIIEKRKLHPHIKLIAAIPFYGQETRWKQSDVNIWRYLKNSANQVVYISEGGYHPYKMQVRNEWMVDHSSTLLAIWNGDKKGGTFNCVNYARKAPHKPEIIYFFPEIIGV